MKQCEEVLNCTHPLLRCLNYVEGIAVQILCCRNLQPHEAALLCANRKENLEKSGAIDAALKVSLRIVLKIKKKQFEKRTIAVGKVFAHIDSLKHFDSTMLVLWLKIKFSFFDCF